MNFIQSLRSAFQNLGAEGYAEDVIEFGGHSVKIRTLSAAESAQVKTASVEVDGEMTRIEQYLHTMRVEALSRAIIALDGVQIPDFVDVDGDRQQKHIILRELVSQWGDAVLSAIYRAYIDLEERAEAAVRQKVRYQPPDYQAAIDWHRKEIEKIEKGQKERERWLAATAANTDQEVVPEEVRPGAEPAPQRAEVAPAGAQSPGSIPGAGRVRMEGAPPPPPSRANQDAPSIQLDDDTFLSADPDVMRSAIQREEERLAADRVRRMASAAMIATQAAGHVPAPPSVDSPIQRRYDAIGIPAADDPNELRRQPIPPGGPGRLELNPQVGQEGRNPRFQAGRR